MPLARRAWPAPAAPALIALLALAAVVALPPAPAVAHASCAEADRELSLAAPRSSEVLSLEASALCLVNAERARRAMVPLLRDARLHAAARTHSIDMVRHRYFGHVDRRGRDSHARILLAGWPEAGSWLRTGENLAWGSGRRSRPAEIVRMWLASPGHRRNMLDPDYREAGIGVAHGGPVANLQLGAGTYSMTLGQRRVSPRRAARGVAPRGSRPHGGARLTAARILPRAFRARTCQRRSRRQRCHPYGTRIGVRSTVNGWLTVSFHARRGGSWHEAGSVTRRLRAGNQRLRFTGLVRNGRSGGRLRPGTYRVVLQGTDQQGRPFARPRIAGVRVVRR